MSEADSEGSLPLNVVFEAKSVRPTVNLIVRLTIRGQANNGNRREKIFVNEANKNGLR